MIHSGSFGLKLQLTAGFSVVLLLLVFVLFAGLSNMEDIESRLNAIVENHNVKTALVSEMRNAARDRTISMYRMITLSDPFARDSETLSFNHFAAEFVKARTRLLDMPLDAHEKELLDTQGKITGYTVGLQNQVVDLALRDAEREASELLQTKTIPAQDRVFAVLAELQAYQTQSAHAAERDAQDSYNRARSIILVFGSAALVLGVAIAIYVVRHSIQSEARLFREKQRAEVTLHSIGEGVITTDARGVVDYMNDVAGELTGWNLQQAAGRALSEIFQVTDENSAAVPNPVLRCISGMRVVSAPHYQTLRSRDGQPFSIEYSAAPIRDFDGSALGAILVFRNVTALHNLSQQMAYQATHDALTGLINRKEFERRLEYAHTQARSGYEQHALLYVDLDQFKVVNDTCGHVAGDELLKQVATCIHQQTRRKDTLARLGGDEFGLLLHHCPHDNATTIADELLRNVQDLKFTWEGKTFEIRASVGVVPIDSNTHNVAEILAAADSACYVAKEQGRNRVQVYRADDAALAKRHGDMQWLSRIRLALQENRFQLFHQRIVPIAGGNSIEHHEILLRMLDEDGRIVPPGAFIPAAERYDLMPAIDRWVLDATFKFLAANPQLAREHLWAINLSGQTVCDPHLLGFLTHQLAHRGVAPQALCFELTETTAVSNLALASKLITTLKGLGCKFALDDFGSGLSSFNYLKNLPVDYLKIDGSFVKFMLDSPKDLAMVQSIHEIGKIHGLRTIAEFVETPAIAEKLQQLGVDYAQGYAFHRPENLAEWAHATRQTRSEKSA